MAKPASPDWPLCDEWAIGIDPYNWTLYRRLPKKGGGYGRWNPVGFYPSVESLLKGLVQKLSRSKPLDDDLLSHVEAVYEAVESRAARFLALLEQSPYPTLRQANSRPQTSQREAIA
jgi:hypothetical protein